MPGLPSRRDMDGYKRLSAAVIRRSILDAQDGDAKAESWLRGLMLPWSEELEIDPKKLHVRLEHLLKPGSLQQLTHLKV